jgi:hypothetical protein
MAMDQRTLLILVRLAHALERMTNKSMGLMDKEPFSEEQAKKVFEEVRALFEEQQRIMTGEGSLDE